MKKSLTIILTVVIIIITSILCYLSFNNLKDTQPSVKIKTIEESSKTKLYCVLNVPMEKNNMIWCGTFQLAWNELRDNIIKEDIKLIGEDKLCNELNKKSFDKGFLNEKDYIAMAGYNKDNIVQKINTALKEKFNEDGKWKVEAALKRPDDILAYSFLKKNLEFQYAFENIKEGLEFNGTKVKAFGIYETKDAKIKDKLTQQVKILYYNNDNSFIISLVGKNCNDEIILAKIPPKDTFKNTLNHAQSLVDNSKEESFSSSDTLKVPMLGVSIKKNFKELENKFLKNSGFEEYAIASALQRVDFSLSEKGAKLKSKAEIAMGKSNAPLKTPKKLIFDEPFLLCMKEKDKCKPYLVMWVDNKEVMIRQ